MKGESQIKDLTFKEFLDSLKPKIDILKSRAKLIAIFNCMVLVLTLIYYLFISSPYYISKVKILPDFGTKSQVLSNFSGLASLAGINLDNHTPMEVYLMIAVSEEIIHEIAYTQYRTETYENSVNLIEYFEIEPEKKASHDLKERSRFLKFYKIFTKKYLTSEIDKKAGSLTLSVEMPEPQLSATVANNLAEAIDRYIRTKRRRNVEAELTYLNSRLKSVQDSLRYAEKKLEEFLLRNRNPDNSPSISTEFGRLRREVKVQEAVFVELKKQLEISKIEKIKNTPIVNILERAQNPIFKSGPKRLISTIVILLVSFFASALSVMIFVRPDS